MRRPGDKGDRSIALFLLALLLFSPLFLSIFSSEKLIWGFPPLFLYLFTVWGGIILAVAWSASKDADDSTGALDPYSSPVIDTLGAETRNLPDKELEKQQEKEQLSKDHDHVG
ncbi:hypothetical protein [Kiloniella sp.]|uniref:hypothetical protein n=1 Tax=Kiloniella sp. TaxID=1938587 RepID=UPI003A94E879